MIFAKMWFLKAYFHAFNVIDYPPLERDYLLASRNLYNPDRTNPTSCFLIFCHHWYMAVPPSCKSSLGMQSWLLKALVSMASEISLHARSPGSISLHARSPGSLAMLCRASFKMDTLISTSLDQFVQCQIHCCHVTELIYRVDASPRPIGKVDWRNKLIALKKSAHCC